jgi:putative redox protein
MARITAELTSGTEVTISNGRHTWRADEPPDHGNDTGPTPYEMLVGALAGCTAITLALYCRHKQIPLKAVTATYEHGRIHAEDCKNCDEPTEGMIDQITSRIRIVGSFDDEQRKRLTQIVGRCPVHKTLRRPVDLVDEVEFGS